MLHITFSLRDRALGVLGVIALFFIATSPFSTMLLIKRQAHWLVDDTVVGLTSAGEATLRISESFLQTSLALASTNQAVRDQLMAQVGELAKTTDDQLKEYEHSIFDSTDRQNFQQLMARRAAFRQIRTRVIALLDEGKRREALGLYRTEGLQEYQKYLKAQDDLLDYNVRQAKSRGANILRLCNTFLLIQSILMVFFFIYAFYVPFIALLEKLTRKENIPDL